MNALPRTLAVPSLLPLALAACASRPTVRYDDPGAVETLTVDFGSTDLQMIAEAMVQSAVRSPVLAGPDRPVLYVGQVENRTSEHIDTVNITDTIRTTLLKSGRVQFAADPGGRREIADQADYQRSGAVSPETAMQIGRQVGADYVLYGRFTSIEKRAGREKDVFYKFTLNLVDVESGLLEWAEEKEIRKGEKRRAMGW